MLCEPQAALQHLTLQLQTLAGDVLTLLAFRLKIPNVRITNRGETVTCSIKQQ